jgi:transposase InsO family protein
LAKSCLSCIEKHKNPPVEVGHHWEAATFPWQRIHCDYAGPFRDANFLITVDSYSGWPEVYVTSSTTSSKTIEMLDSMFSRYGNPVTLVTDNGPQFVSAETEDFLKSRSIIHRTSALYNPSTNGRAERMVQTIKDHLKAELSASPRTDLSGALNRILMQYRKIPLSSGKSPAKLFLGREIRTNLDALCEPNRNDRDESYVETSVVHRSFQEGESVLIRDYCKPDKWRVGKVLKKLGILHYEVRTDQNYVWRRHVDQLRGTLCRSSTNQDFQFDIIDPPEVPQKHVVNIPVNQHGNLNLDTEVRRSQRERRPPNRLTL